MDKDFRLSPSTIKRYKACPFQFYCNKVKPQKQDDNVSTEYGDGGNAVHKSIEHYYNHIDYEGISEPEVISECKSIFELQWEKSGLGDKLDKNLYWLCVLNAIKLKLKPTELETQFIVDLDKVKFKGYADFVNTDNHFIMDWKTSTYKTRKVEEYKHQVRYYAWAYWKQKGTIPEVAVFFAKVGRMFKWKFTEAELLETQKELEGIWSDIQRRVKENDFPRNPSRSTCFFCPYKDTCATDLLKHIQESHKIKFHLKRGDKLIIEGNIPEELHKQIEDKINYKMKNAFFMIQFYLKKYGKKIDGIERLYKRKPTGAECYIGYMQLISDIMLEYFEMVRFEIIDYRNREIMDMQKDNAKYITEYILYSYQNEAVDKLLRYRWGTIEIGTGGGKTDIAAKAIADSKVSKVLFVIDNKDLLIQTKNEYTKMLPNHKITIVGMGQKDWSGDIVLSTIQTLARHIKETEFKIHLADFNCLVADESHGWAAKSYEKLSKNLLNTKYRWGFSATQKRDDGDTNMIFAFNGTVIYKKPALELTKMGVLTPVTARFYHYSKMVFDASSEKEYEEQYESAYASEYRQNIVDNKKRNELVVQLTKDRVAQGKQVMILCKLVDHLNLLKGLIPEAELIYGQTDDIERVDGLERFKLGKSNVLIGNIAIFNKGINIKNLDVLINAAANAGEVKTIQSIGRALRKDEGKTEAEYIDFMDYGEYCKSASKKRKKALEAEGYKVEIIA